MKTVARVPNVSLATWLSVLTAMVWAPQAMASDAAAPPLRLVVPFSAGGATDAAARVLAQAFGRAGGRTVIVDNKPGAGSTLGAAEVARAAPDGNTLLVITPTHLIGTALYRRLAYDPLRDFVPVAKIATGPLVMVVAPTLKVDTVQQFIAVARTRPGALQYATSGNGSTQHLAGHWFEVLAKVDLLHVPYKGSAQVTADVIGGTVGMSFMALPNALPHVRSGRLRALAVTSPTRSPDLPAVPTMEESGVAGYRLTSWVGLMAPARTPAEVVARLHDQINRLLQAPEAAADIGASGSQISIGSLPAFRDELQTESKKWLELARSSQIVPQ